MQLLLNKRMKHYRVQNAAYYNKLRDYFVVYFQITLVSQRHSSVLVEKHAHFMFMSSPSAHACATQDASSVITVTVLPFDQMEPSRSMQTRLGNPVRTPNRNGIFPTSELSFTWVNDRLMTNS